MSAAETDRHGFVLVVDDDQDIRDALESVLGARGHGVATAANGQEAIEVLRGERGRPCLILLDLMMPRMNGIEMHAALQADPALSDIPIVIITGTFALAAAHADTLPTAVLRKPFNTQVLMATVNRFCSPTACQS